MSNSLVERRRILTFGMTAVSAAAVSAAGKNIRKNITVRVLPSGSSRQCGSRNRDWTVKA